MQKVKAILCDFDGTLVNWEKKYSKNTKNLIGQIQKKGIRFSLATGRIYYGVIEKVVKELGIDGIHIIHGGAMIYDSLLDKKYWYQPISKTSIDVISDYLIKRKIIFAYETERSIYMSPKVIGTSYLKNAELLDIKEYKKEDVMKLLIFASANGFSELQIDGHIKQMQKLVKDVEILKSSFNGYFGIDMTSQYSTKHTAVLEYCKILGLSSSEIVAIGDGHNDYPLFTASGFKIAMGNAYPELKEIADLVVETSDNGGIEEALNFILKKLT